MMKIESECCDTDYSSLHEKGSGPTTLGALVDKDIANCKYGVKYYGEDVLVGGGGEFHVFDRTAFNAAREILVPCESEGEPAVPFDSICPDLSETERGIRVIAHHRAISD